MIIAAEYSFNSGYDVIYSRWPHLVKEIEEIVTSVDANVHKTKRSREKTMPGRMLFLALTASSLSHDLVHRFTPCSPPSQGGQPGVLPLTKGEPEGSKAPSIHE